MRVALEFDFWHDVLCRDVTLKDICPYFFPLAVNKDATITGK